MTAPALNRKLLLEEAQRLSDGAGGYTETWVALGTVWAAVMPGTGKEKAGESVRVSQVVYRVIVRGAPVGAPSRPKPDQRFREGSRLFHIAAVTEEDPAGHYLVCLVREEVLS